MNDLDLDIVARNVIMLLIALTVDNMDEVADCIIHIWYSALIRKSALDILQQRVRPLIEDVCEKIKSKLSSAILAKTWTFGQRSMRLVLKKVVVGQAIVLYEHPGRPNGRTGEPNSHSRYPCGA